MDLGFGLPSLAGVDFSAASAGGCVAVSCLSLSCLQEISSIRYSTLGLTVSTHTHTHTHGVKCEGYSVVLENTTSLSNIFK